MGSFDGIISMIDSYNDKSPHPFWFFLFFPAGGLWVWKRKRAEPQRVLPMIVALVYVAIYCSLLKANTIVSSNFFIFFHSSVLKTSSPLSILLRIS